MPFYCVPPAFGNVEHHRGPFRYHGPHRHRHHHHLHQGPPFPPPAMVSAGRGPPRFGRRGRRFTMNNETKKKKVEFHCDENVIIGQTVVDKNPTAFAFGGINKPVRRPHCQRGGPRGRCSDLPREELPLMEEVIISRGRNNNNNEEKMTKTKTEPSETVPKGPPGVGASFRHYPPRPPHIRRRRHQQHFHNKMVLLSLLEEQKRAMEEIQKEEQVNKNNNKNRDEIPAQPNRPSENPAATTASSSAVIQAPQQWHMEETDQALILAIDVTGFKLENLELKVEHGLLSLQGLRTNSLGDVFELHRTKKIDPILYDEAGIEAKCDDPDSNSSIVRITIPKKVYINRSNDTSIPILVARECPEGGGDEEPSPTRTTARTTSATVMEDTHRKEQTTETNSTEQDNNFFIPEAEIVFERDEEEDSTALGQTDETVQDSLDGNLLHQEQPLENAFLDNDDDDDDEVYSDSATTQSWEDLVVDGREEE